MKKFLIAAIAAATFCGEPALAADYPTKASSAPATMWNWTGFYVGVQGGWSEKGDGLHVLEFNNINAPTRGWSGGVTAGYNWQIGKSLIGLEVDYSWADITANNQSTGAFGCGGGGLSICGSRIDQFGTARARIGMLAMPTLLLYATGGAAWAHVDRHVFSFATGLTSDQWGSRTGWTLGGGIEAMLAPNWTAKIEALYVDLGSHFYPAFPGVVVGYTQFDNFMVYRAGVNYKFGTW